MQGEDPVAQITSSPPISPRLGRRPDLLGAVMARLGAMVGAGVFIGIGIGAGVAGPAVTLAILLAALVAICTGFSSARLALGYPAGESTYEYGYKYLNRFLGFIAGWMFLLAESAAAATAALGVGGYLLGFLHLPGGQVWQMGLGLLAVLLPTGLLLAGRRRSAPVMALVGGVTVVVLVGFVLAGLPILDANGLKHFVPFFVPPSTGVSPWRSVLHATALLFVAFAGHQQIHRQVQENIPGPGESFQVTAIALGVATALYLAVAVVAIGSAGAGSFATLTRTTAAPLALIADSFPLPGMGLVLALGAILAMLHMVFHLLLRLSRMTVVMSRRRDMPLRLARLHKPESLPEAAVAGVGLLVAGLVVLVGDLDTLWALSAFGALVYAAITNLSALQLPTDAQRLPRIVATVGLVTSLFLAFWVEPVIWITGCALVLAGLAWKWGMHWGR